MGDIWHDVSWVVPYRNEGLTTIFEAFTWLGYPGFVMLFLPLGYWLWNKNKFTRLTAVVILATLLNTFLKDYWQNPRRVSARSRSRRLLWNAVRACTDIGSFMVWPGV
jgi:hypothetical protein